MRWRDLGWKAKAFRVVHAAWSVAGLASLVQVWACALGARRGGRLVASVGFLAIEGIGLLIGRGNCPMGPKAAEWGDPVPFFELVLPPRAAKVAVPVLAIASLAGLAGVGFRLGRR